jgi:predicted dehydrogenase
MARHFPYASHAQVLSALPAFGWDAVVDPDPAARARARDRWGIANTAADLADLGAAETYDVAVLATPPAARRAALDRLSGLRAVVVEKPLAPSLAEAERFADAVRARRLLTQVNYWRRAEPACRALAGGDLAARIGRAQAAFGVYGNGLRNNGSHLIDLIRMLLGEPTAVRALGPARPLVAAPLAGDVAVPFALTLAEDAMVTVQPIDFRHYREVALDIWGTEGRLVLDQETLSARHMPVRAHRGLAAAREVASDAPVTLPVEPGHALRHLYDNLLGALDRGEPLVSPLGSALETERLIEAVFESARRGGAVVATRPAGPPIMVADAR